MIRFVRSVSTLVLGGLLAFSPGCGGSDGSGGNGGAGGSSSDATTSTGETTASGATCAATCSTGEECPNLVCECSDRSSVNTSACNNACCATEAEACPGSCEDHGGWGAGRRRAPGAARAAPPSARTAPATASARATSASTSTPTTTPSRKCTKTCSFGGGECNAGWFCAEINGGEKYLCLVQQ